MVKPPFSFDGKVTIEKDAIQAMCRHLLELGEHVQKIHELEIQADDDGLEINVVLDLKLQDRSALSIARLLQKKASTGLSYFTGMDVRRVNIKINEVSF